MFRRLDSLLMFRMSASVRGVWAIPPPCFEERRMMLLAISWVLIGGLAIHAILNL